MKEKDSILDYTTELFGIKLRIIDVLFFSVMLGLGLSMRLKLYDFESGDYYYFLSKWMEECHNAGGFGYLGIEPGITDKSTINYGWMYQYVIVILYYFRSLGSDMHLLKTVSVIFDVVCAITVMRISYLVTGADQRKAVLSFGIVMFLPTVMLNGAAWAQCDSIYSAFALLAILHLMKGNDSRVFIYLAIAYTFKQQAIFILPFVIIMWLKGKVKLRYIFWMPIVVFISMIPAVIAGRSFGELLSIYSKQAATYTQLTMNYPSIYSVISSLLREDYRKMMIAAGTIAVVAVLGALAYYIRDKKFEVTYLYMVTLLIFTAEVCLFTLPVMHERYGYLPEVLLVVYGVTGYKRMALCFSLQAITLTTYSRFLFGSTVSETWILSYLLFVIILFVGYDLYLQMREREVKHG